MLRSPEAPTCCEMSTTSPMVYDKDTNEWHWIIVSAGGWKYCPYCGEELPKVDTTDEQAG